MARDLSDDFKVLDRYQAFSTEVLRLGLLGIGAIGVLVVGGKGISPLVTATSTSILTKIAILLSLSGFAAACAFALCHRYWSTDAMACLKKLSDLREMREPDESKITAEFTGMERAFDLSTRSIGRSAVALAVGAIALAITFALALT